MRLFRLAMALLAVSALAADARLDGLLQQVENRYNHVKTLQVFFQEQYTRPGQIRRTERGVLLLRKPGRTRWDYTEPQGKLVLSDGKFLYIYTPDTNQAEKTRLEETADMQAPLAFLLGKLNFHKEFKNIQGVPDSSAPGAMRITAESAAGNLPYSAVEFVVTPDARISKVKATAYDKSVLDFTFDQEKVDLPLDARLFQFRLPAGAQLVEDGR